MYAIRGCEVVYKVAARICFICNEDQCIPSPETRTAKPAAMEPHPSREIQLGERDSA
jgi:hypothetical protein